MSYLSLYRKWRPGTFEEVLGQAHVTGTLTAALREGRVAHAYLFAGPRGTGKTSTARILARALNCERGVTPSPCGSCRPCREVAEGTSLDVFEMDAASHTSVDDIRDIRDRIPLAAVSGGHKVYIIDEAHQLSASAFNALLKMLEEPPSHVVFVLCTTEAHKLPATVASRCQRFEFRRLPPALIAEHLAAVARAEGLQAEPGALLRIARHAAGSVRDALSLLDQAAGSGGGEVTERLVLELVGEAPEEVLLEVGRAIAEGDVLAAFRVVDRVLERGWDPRQLLRQLLEHLRSLLLARRGADDLLDLDDELRAAVREQAHAYTPAHLERAIRILGESQAELRWSAHPRLTLEVAIARAAQLEADDLDALRARLERLERLLVQRADEAPQPPAEPRERAPVRRPAAEAGGRPRRERESPRPAPAPDASLEERWRAFLEGVRARKRTTHALLKEAWPVSVDGGVLVVGFEKSFHAEAIQRPDHAPHLRAAAEEAFGVPLRLRPEVMPGQRPSREAPVVEAADPVDLVVRGLGAEVVEEVEA